MSTSSAANGSSNNRTLGLLSNARAITNFFFCPPERNFAGIFMNFFVAILGLYVQVQIYQHPCPKNKIGSNHWQFGLLGG